MQETTPPSPSTTKRLHITPFAPDLLHSVLTASIRPLATEISFHCIPTFPENSYGYVTLPAMEADKIKKKLNGSILKGRKFKVDSARPQKRQRDEVEEEEDAKNAASDRKSSSGKKAKKSKENVIDGHELPSDRQVKRGWTESTSLKNERRKEEKRKGKDPKKSKSQPKSKYTEKPECLFRTNVPPNRSSPIDEKQSKKKKKPSKDSVVHEFANTISHPSFIKSGDNEAAPMTTFEDGKGWVDDTGNIKEPVSDRIRKEDYRPGQVAGAKEKRRPAKEEKTSFQKPKTTSISQEEGSTDESEDWTSSSGATSSEDSASDSESDDDSVSSSSSDVSESSSSDEEPDTKSQTKNATGTDDLDSKSPTDTKDESPAEVHPLEALFKKPAPGSVEHKPDPEANAQFSFFGQGDVESEEETEPAAAPQTPYTKRDLQGRGLRSAAPTPDTALVGRSLNWNADQTESMDVDDEVYTNTPVPKVEAGREEESEFTKWFWENRGDNNRAWKKRRRDAAKEQRQLDNRRKGMKGKS